MNPRKSDEIRTFLIQGINDNKRGIVSETATHFGVTRQAILRHVHNLQAEGKIQIQGKTRNRQYTVIPIAKIEIPLTVSPSLEEDVVWRQHIRPALEGIRSNVLEICQYGFTEMLRNVIDHSESSAANARLNYFPGRIKMAVIDFGVGIFNKIQKTFKLNDPRDAILELTKGKLTTDPQRHTGEGIFFTSRMFDRFSILSEKLYFAHRAEGDDWLLEDEKPIVGTLVEMIIDPLSTRTVQTVFNKFSSSKDDFGFFKTHVPVRLARYGNENLVSRSQAKRLLSRFERFGEIILDFKGVSTIGQAFADEIFRVFRQDHPDINIYPINISSQIKRMINRARTVTVSSNTNPSNSV